MILIFAEVLK